MGPPVDNAVFISDLHLFSPRSVADARPAWISRQYSDKELLVLGGDIFDFRWSYHRDFVTSLRAADDWLGDLVTQWHGRIVYLPGNHDSHPDFLDLLERHQAENADFSWNYHGMQFGHTLCLHGDLYDAGSQAALQRYRARFHEEHSRSVLAHRVYDVAVAARVHRVVPQFRNQFGRICDTLANSLADYAQDGVQTIIFGHTHHPICGRQAGDFRFFNPGAALKHLAYQPIRFRVH